MCQVDAMSESARREESSEGGSSNTNNSVAAAQGNKPTKHLKRALTGTIGAGLAVAAALLLIRSEEIGDWLQSVTPHVLPNAAVGAEILQMALAEVKTCFQEGVNVCLDAEGGVTALYTYISQWYLSPEQHVIEMAVSILLLTPLVYMYFKLCRGRVRLQRAAGTFNVKRSPLVAKLWGAGLLGHVGAGAFLKFTKNELMSHPAYLWQPCHVHSLVMGLCMYSDSEVAVLVMHVATTLWWGPFLAFVAPALPDNYLEIAIFWGQHALMLLAPFFRLLMGAQWMYRDFWWNSVGFLFLTCYHWWWLAPVTIVTGVNVATMSVPPVSLEMFGKYYRLFWGISCMALQFMAVMVMCVLARLSGKWPPRPAAKRVVSAKSSSVHDEGVGSRNGSGKRDDSVRSSVGSGRIASDAVRIPQDDAVSFVGGD